VAVDPKEEHAAVLIPLCNVNDQPGILLELRGKLRTHSGEIRCAVRDAAVILGTLIESLPARMGL
jgi:hypothetical protein